MSGVKLDRINDRLDTLHDIGRTEDDGVTRPAYSERESEAITYVKEALPDAFETETDPYGNLFASPWPEASDSVYIGSHLDSVYNGGPLDGTLGVVIAMEVVQTLYESGVDPPRPPTLAVFRAEESARFGVPMIGSRLALGLFDEADLKDFEGDEEVTIWEAMHKLDEIDLSPPLEPSIDTEGSDIAGFLEVHIEQGRVLEQDEDDIGIVTDIRAPVRIKLTVSGRWDHSGATPMSLRDDALAGAAEMIKKIEKCGIEAAQPEDKDIVATVGTITAGGDQDEYEPSVNRICGEVTFQLELRSVDVGYRDQVERQILQKIQDVARERELDVKLGGLGDGEEPIAIGDYVDAIEETPPRNVSQAGSVDDPAHNRDPPTPLSKSVQHLLGRAADNAGVDYQYLHSGGGHDAMHFQREGVPTGMVFVPSLDGISHHPDERTFDESKTAAAETLLHAFLQDSPESS